MNSGSEHSATPTWCGVESSGDSALRDARRTTTPVGHFGLIDLVTLIVLRGEARRLSDGAVDVHHSAANATNQMMVVVINPVFVTGG